jgi:chromosome segregation ATPase
MTLEAERQDREAERREQAEQHDAQRQDRDAERRRGAELEAARAQAEEAGKSLYEQAEQLRAERDRLQAAAAAFDSERQAAERDRQAERDRLCDALARAEERAAAAARRGEELDARLAALHQELEAARANQVSMGTHAAERAELEQRLAEATDEYLSSIAWKEQRESEAPAAIEPHTSHIESLPEPLESPPEPTAPAGPPPVVFSPGSTDQEQPLEELRRELREARDGSGRFRGFLTRFGAHRRATGKEPK